MALIKSGGFVFDYYIRRKQKICKDHAWSNPGFFYVRFQEVSDTWQAGSRELRWKSATEKQNEIERTGSCRTKALWCGGSLNLCGEFILYIDEIETQEGLCLCWKNDKI